MLWPVLAVFGSSLANFVLSTDATTYSSTDTMVISWTESRNLPSIDSFSSANFYLCTYDAAGDLDCPIKLEDGADISGVTELSFDLSSVSSDGPAGMYVIQLNAAFSSSEYALVYSTEWLTITGFTGSGTATNGTLPIGSVTGNMIATDLSIPSEYSDLSSSWLTPYVYQQGVTRYAPTVQTPGTSVTAPLTVTRRFSTSSYSIFTTYYYTLLPLTTMTASGTATQTFRTNSASSYVPSYTGRTATRATPTVVYRERRWAD